MPIRTAKTAYWCPVCEWMTAGIIEDEKRCVLYANVNYGDALYVVSILLGLRATHVNVAIAKAVRVRLSQFDSCFFVCCNQIGEDQKPHLELTNVIARRFNRQFGKVFARCRFLAGDTPRLVGTDGQAKMSKSLGNAIQLLTSN